MRFRVPGLTPGAAFLPLRGGSFLAPRSGEEQRVPRLAFASPARLRLARNDSIEELRSLGMTSIEELRTARLKPVPCQSHSLVGEGGAGTRSGGGLGLAAGTGQQRDQILVVNTLLAVSQGGKSLVNRVQFGSGQGESQLRIAPGQGVASGMLAQHNAVAGRAHG